MVRRLQAGDAQAFVDAMDKVRYHVPRFRGMGWFTLLSPSYILSIRRWTGSTSHQTSEGNV